VIHLHHLSHLQQAVARAYPGLPVVTTLHGTDLKLLDQAQQVTRLARRAGVPLTALRDACDHAAGEPPHASLARLLRHTALTEADTARALATDWRLWPHAGTWSARMRRNARLADRIVVVSPSDLSQASRLLGLPAAGLTVIPNGVDTTVFTPRRLTSQQRLSLLRRWLVDDPRGWGPGQEPGSIRYTTADLTRLTDATGTLRPLLLWVGRFQQVKRLGVLLKAFARLASQSDQPPALLLWGGYPGETEGEHPLTTARRLGIDAHVYFAGWRGHEELPDGLNCADLMVAPAVNESFGMVYIEAQACGTPPVATSTGGPATLITSHGPGADGWTVEPDDDHDLANTLAAALAAPAERARRAANGAARARALYSWPAITGKYQDTYDTARRLARSPATSRPAAQMPARP
jgi:glycosyltransferase involved in cell wall biosynthesis